MNEALGLDPIAIEEAWQAADEITAANDEDGVTAMIEGLL